MTPTMPFTAIYATACGIATYGYFEGWHDSLMIVAIVSAFATLDFMLNEGH